MFKKITTTIAASIVAMTMWAGGGDDLNSVIVTIDQVGAHAMPDSIMPVGDAPFAVKPFRRPVVKGRSVTMTSRQVSDNGLITPAINDTIAKLSAEGGGTVILPAGLWHSGRINLCSNIVLRIDSGATLEFSADISAYQPAVFTRHEGVEVMSAGAFLYADSAVNIVVTGKGTISGPPMDAPMRSLPNGNSVVEKDIDPNMPVCDRICDGLEGRTFYRPKSFAPINCANVLVEGVTFERSVLWNVNPIYCDNVIIRGITVNSTDVPSGDGIDISSCSNVLIEFCTLNCGDDCFTLKAGRCEDGIRVGKPTENVVIRNCLAKDGHGGVTCGSETAGVIRNVLIERCVFDGTRAGLRFKTRRNRGGGVNGIYCNDLRFIGIGEAFTFDLLGSPQYMGVLARRDTILPITPLTPDIYGIHVSRFIVENAERMASVSGIPETPCRDIVIENGTVNTGVLFKRMRDLGSMTFRSMTINAADNNVTLDNVHSLLFDNVDFDMPDNQINLNIEGTAPSNLLIKTGESTRRLSQGANNL